MGQQYPLSIIWGGGFLIFLELEIFSHYLLFQDTKYE